MSENVPEEVEEIPEDFDPSFDPTKGQLDATEFPPDEFDDIDQTAEDLGTEDADDIEDEPSEGVTHDDHS